MSSHNRFTLLRRLQWVDLLQNNLVLWFYRRILVNKSQESLCYRSVTQVKILYNSWYYYASVGHMAGGKEPRKPRPQTHQETINVK